MTDYLVAVLGIALCILTSTPYLLPLLCFWVAFLATGVVHLSWLGSAWYEQHALHGPRPPVGEQQLRGVLYNLRSHVFTSLAVAGGLALVPPPAALNVWLDALPSALRVAVSFAATLVLLELWFYHVHRAMHWPALYWMHEQHHRFTRPFALAALYGTTWEFLLLNVPAVFLGPWLTQLGAGWSCVWLAVVGVDIAVGHSGHQVHRWHDTAFHDAHHVSFKTNFGVLYVLDKLYGTVCRDARVN